MEFIYLFSKIKIKKSIFENITYTWTESGGISAISLTPEDLLSELVKKEAPHACLYIPRELLSELVKKPLILALRFAMWWSISSFKCALWSNLHCGGPRFLSYELNKIVDIYMWIVMQDIGSRVIQTQGHTSVEWLSDSEYIIISIFF